MATTTTQGADAMTFNATTSAITARDFSRSTIDKHADDWTIGKMRHLIAALDGRQVLITTEAQTGHTVVARLLEARDTRRGGMWTPSVLTEIDLGNGETQRTWRDLRKLGPAIIEVPVPNQRAARWDALNSYMREDMALQAAAGRRAAAEGLGTWASYTVDHHGDFANVTRHDGKVLPWMCKIDGAELAELTAAAAH